jgi:RNA polymerase-binding transcription factor
MEKEKARALLDTELTRVKALLGETLDAGQEDRDAANEPGDMTDSAEPLTDEEGDDAVAAGLRDRLAALERAERRLEEGTFGLSVRSGRPISDARLEADPAAELTADEAANG